MGSSHNFYQGLFLTACLMSPSSCSVVAHTSCATKECYKTFNSLTTCHIVSACTSKCNSNRTHHCRLVARDSAIRFGLSWLCLSMAAGLYVSPSETQLCSCQWCLPRNNRVIFPPLAQTLPKEVLLHHISCTKTEASHGRLKCG